MVAVVDGPGRFTYGTFTYQYYSYRRPPTYFFWSSADGGRKIGFPIVRYVFYLFEGFKYQNSYVGKMKTFVPPAIERCLLY